MILGINWGQDVFCCPYFDGQSYKQQGFFLPSSETSYIGPFFFLFKENTWIIQLNYVLQEKSKGN